MIPQIFRKYIRCEIGSGKKCIPYTPINYKLQMLLEDNVEFPVHKNRHTLYLRRPDKNKETSPQTRRPSLTKLHYERVLTK